MACTELLREQKIVCFVHMKLPGSSCLTWVGNRGDSDFVVGFTGAEACDNILNPPQLLSDLDFLLLLKEKQRNIHTHTYIDTFSLKHTVKLLVYRDLH